jgi:hypothetical protein
MQSIRIAMEQIPDRPPPRLIVRSLAKVGAEQLLKERCP